MLRASLVLIDSHCHLDSAYFPEGPDAVMARARLVGVVGFVVIGVGDSLIQAREAVALARRSPAGVAATVGVHPHDATSMDAMDSELRILAANEVVVAVGETGLDYHYDSSPRAQQRDAFARQIAIARAVSKPLIVHTRSAAQETLELLRSERAREVGGIIHCFSEDKAFAQSALDLGFDISFSGIVTFKSATAIQEVAAWAPADRILVETDSPYLAPVPMRGKPCEPAYVAHTARRVAELRGIDERELGRLTRANTERRLGRTFA
jgi:TatD DNase family protein